MNILVVDDEIIYLDLLSEVLTLYGHAVFKATSADAALGHLHTQQIDLIISDVSMPGKNGVSLHTEVREDYRFQRVPFVWNTAYVELQELLDLVDPSVDYKVEKSKGLPTLLHIVSRVQASRKIAATAPAA
ncbi:MAG TPA: response regulator [Bacteroidota bacterium]|nr:response regulator [Bacteroidota bacterium]